MTGLELWRRCTRWVLYREQLDIDEGTLHAVRGGYTLCDHLVNPDVERGGMWVREEPASRFRISDVTCRHCRRRLVVDEDAVAVHSSSAKPQAAVSCFGYEQTFGKPGPHFWTDEDLYPGCVYCGAAR